ncbi:alpha/beta hydrolase [Tsukamurella sputi]|uniref:Alpha/beta hydrolase n=1 Tax=Tsukamurella sputi TaxID=2591848 RepID=A0A5C5RPU1_9ACTN|nr:alpha/beta hydrolase [Tsukamurella sputi]TWS24672.1 alpha/beta hydrolase [Tsukamurella sputi]
MRSHDVSWQVDGIAVHGTVGLPDGPGPFPGVVLVAGSGPTDRDWNSPLLPGSNGSGRLLAEALAAAGFATVRYDKRASGPHVREVMPVLIGRMSMRSHLDELDGAVAALAGRPEVDATRMVGLGNSEGTLHLMNRALARTVPRFAGLVLTGAPGRSVGAVARTQIGAQVAGLADGEAILRAYDEAVARFRDGEPARPDPALPEGIRTLVESLETPANLLFARELWSADGAALLAGLDLPVLVVIGGKDVQVDPVLDGGPLERAAVGRDVRFAYPADADHVLKHENASRADLVPGVVAGAYNAEGRELDAEAVASIVGWLRERLAK